MKQIANNETEKFGDLKKYIIENRLPLIDGKINVLELGVGGGETIKKLKDQLHGVDNVNFVGLDNALLFSENFRKTTDSQAVVADAGLFPIRENSLSAVNASAIMHEISSSGANTENGNKVYGQDAIKKTFNEIRRCLAENGVLIYRDVACPKNRLELKDVEYERKSWQMFMDIYFPVLLKSGKRVSPEILDGFEFNDKDKASLRASAQVHREIQRHYITFRDYYRKKVFPEIGAKVIKEDWEDKEKGDKRHNIELSGIALKIYLEKIGSSDQAKGVKNLSLVMSSDDYDDFTDELIEYGLKEGVADFYEEWLRREGGEIYTYLSPDEIKLIAADSVGRDELVAEKETMASRYYYQRYLDRIIKNPEFEGKQIINFIKKYDK